MGVVVSYFSDTNVGQKMLLPQDNNSVKVNKPKLNKNLEGPNFTTLDYNKIYATRHYGRTVWASTIETNVNSVEEAWKRARSRLNKYFNGKNQSGSKLPRTCPVTLRKPSGNSSSSSENTDVTISLPLPKAIAEDAPGPQHKQVYVCGEPKKIYYTGYFHKPFHEEDLHYNLTILRNKLRANDEDFRDDFYQVVFYDTQKTNMRKLEYFEIWFEGRREEDDYICLQNYEESEEDIDDMD